MERTYRFAINYMQGDADQYNFEELPEEDDTLIDFDIESLKNKFDVEFSIFEYEVPKYQECCEATILGKDIRRESEGARFWRDPEELVCEYLLTNKYGIGFHAFRYEDDEEYDKFEVGDIVECVTYGSNAEIIAPLGTNLKNQMTKCKWSGYVITATLSAIIDFMKARKGSFLTIAENRSNHLKDYFDFEIGSCSSIEY